MNKKKWTITLSAILLVLLSVAGYFAIAAEYGTQEDPLVTLSYVNNVLSPQVMQKLQQELDAKAGEVSAEIDTKVKAASDEIDKKIAEYQAAAASGTLSEEMINSIADAVRKGRRRNCKGSRLGTCHPQKGSADQFPSWL